MAQYTIFGSNEPYSLGVLSDGGPNITLGSYFYIYGGMASGSWYCSGGRLYIPNHAPLFGNDVTLKIWKSTSTPVDLSTAPIHEQTVTVPNAAGWIEASWPAVPVATGEYVFIGYAFASPVQMAYIYGNAGGSHVRSIDNVDLALAESTISGFSQRSRFRIGAGSTQGSSTGYGTDIIITDSPELELPLPVAEYGFNETSGTTAYDSSGNDYDLTLNSESNLGMGRPVPYAGKALHQVGGGDTHKITNLAPWVDTAHRTLMFWGRRGTEGTDTWSHTVYATDSGGTTVFGIMLNNDSNQVQFRADAGGHINITAPEVSMGSWAHYALTYDQENVTAYIDGVQVGQVPATSVITASDGNLYIYGTDYQQQVIDDLRFFDVALTEEQIQQYMDTVVPAPDTEPPSIPQNLTGNAANQAVTLDWDDSTDDVELQNYIVYRSDTQGFTPAPEDQVGGPSVPSYSETAPVGTWYYRVAARDEAGNISEPSDELELTTTAAEGFFFPSALGWSLGTPLIDDPQATGYNLGVLFALSGPAQLAGGRFYSPEAQTGLAVTLYANGVQVAQKTGLAASTGWNTLLFDTAYHGIGGVDYIVAVYVPGPAPSYHLLTSAPWSQDNSPLAVGPMYSTLSNSTRYTTGLNLPNVASANWYGVDAVVLNDTGDEFDPTFGATIEEENAKPGAFSNEWAISGAGDTTNLGFARQFSVDAGDTVEFSCHGDGTVLDIYRIGWYDGRGWRKVAELTNAATNQPDPNTIADSNGGVECSNWSVTASWNVPADALSGLFVGVYRNLSLDNASYIPFVVRNDARTADVAYKTSDSTWALAYNYYGTPASPLTGKSVYGSGGPLGSISTRTHAVSYHRPIVTREGVPQTYWLACEAPMIRFLERNGIDMKYVASRDVDAGVSVLNNTSVAVSNGHDEYWSDGMRDTFESYRDSGNHVIFFSGNEVFWRTRFDAERDTMWCYKDTMQGPGMHVAGTPLDPIGWTGTWKDTRFPGRKPEHLLTGTDFRMNGVNDYAVTFHQAGEYAAHPFWRDTTLPSGDITVNGIIGFEADEILPTQPEGSYAVLANHNFNIDGKRADDNGQEYTGNGDLNWGVLSQRYASGAVVVGFGTCQWSWGLDATHDRGGNYVNAGMQQATLNLFADLGAVPATTVDGLVTPAPVVSLDVYGAVPDSGRSGKVKVWYDNAWNAHPLKVWDGGEWIAKKAKGHDGTGFIEGDG